MHLFLYNARGYLLSDISQDPAAYGRERSVHDVAAVMQGLGIDRAYIVGLSIGAHAVLQFRAALSSQGIDFANDATIGAIIRRLEEREVSHMIGDGVEEGRSAPALPVKLSAWCYVQQLRRSIKRAYLRTARTMGIGGMREGVSG